MPQEFGIFKIGMNIGFPRFRREKQVHPFSDQRINSVKNKEDIYLLLIRRQGMEVDTPYVRAFWSSLLLIVTELYRHSM